MPHLTINKLFRHWLLLISLFVIAASTPVLAETKAAERNIHVAVKAGGVDYDIPGYDTATNLGLAIGGKLVRHEYIRLLWELEIATTIHEPETHSARGEWEIDSHALYATLHLGGTTYFKLKGGYLQREIRYDNGETDKNSGFSWGVGIGIPVRKNRSLELDYTLMEDDNNQPISYISLAYVFQ